MASNQIGSFSMTDRSVQELKRYYSQGGVSEEVLLPRARGMGPSTVAFVGYVQPATAPQFGQVGTWNLTNDGDYCEEIVLEIQLSQITGVANASYKNDITTIIDTITINQGGTQLARTTQYDLMTLKNQALQDFQKYQGKTICEGVQPLAARQAANAAGPQTFNVVLDTPLDYLNVPLSLLQGFQLQFQILFKPLLQCVQWTGAGAPVASILNANLRVRYVNADPGIVQRIGDLMKVKPIILPFLDWSFSQQELATGTNTSNFLLTDFKGPSAYMAWMLREKQRVFDTTGDTAWNISDTYAWNSWNVQDKGYNIVGRPVDLTYQYSYGYVRPHQFRTYANPATFNIDYCTVHPFCIEAESIVDESGVTARGWYDFSMTQTARLNISFPTAPTPLVLSSFCYSFNAFLLDNGRLTRFYS